MIKGQRRVWLIFVVVMLLSVWPLPNWLADVRPPWVALFVLYLQIYVPHRFRLMWVFLLGLYCDVLFVSVLGEHALALLTMCWLAAGKCRRFVFLSSVQQLLWIGLCCMTYQMILYLLEILMHAHASIFWNMGAAFLGMLFWPWLIQCCGRLESRAK